MCVVLTGCAATGSVKLEPVKLPPSPACMNPVDVPTVSVGDDARAALGRHRAKLVEANSRLKCSKKWYEGVRSTYKGVNQ
jgi:hypothetical protein